MITDVEEYFSNGCGRNGALNAGPNAYWIPDIFAPQYVPTYGVNQSIRISGVFR